MDEQAPIRLVRIDEPRRREILDAAVTLFASRGYRETTVAEIAGELGIDADAFHRHFRCKRDLLDAVLEGVVVEILAVLGAEEGPATAESLAAYRERIERVAAGLYRMWDDNPALRMVLLQADAIDTAFQARFRSVYGLVVTLIVGFLEHGVERGFLRADLEPIGSAEALVGLLLGGALREAYPTGPGDREGYTAAAVQIMLSGVAGVQASSSQPVTSSAAPRTEPGRLAGHCDQLGA